MNSCSFIGNLTRDPEMKFTTGGTAVCNFSIAMNRKYKTAGGEAREEVTYLDLVAWQKTAELVGEYLKKGRQVGVTCRVRQETWEDKETGAKRSKLVFDVNELTFIGGNRDEGSTDSEPAAETEKPKPKPKAPAKSQPKTKAEEPADDSDDVPF